MSSIPPGSSPFIGSSWISSSGWESRQRGDAEPLAHPDRIRADLVARAFVEADTV
jgi:hypothetical protein